MSSPPNRGKPLSYPRTHFNEPAQTDITGGKPVDPISKSIYLKPVIEDAILKIVSKLKK